MQVASVAVLLVNRLRVACLVLLVNSRVRAAASALDDGVAIRSSRRMPHPRTNRSANRATHGSTRSSPACRLLLQRRKRQIR